MKEVFDFIFLIIFFVPLYFLIDCAVAVIKLECLIRSKKMTRNEYMQAEWNLIKEIKKIEWERRCIQQIEREENGNE